MSILAAALVASVSVVGDAEAQARLLGMGATVGRVGSLMGTALVGGAVLAGAALIGLGVHAATMSGNFQQATSILVTSAGESVKNIDMVRAGILQMSVDTATSWQQLTAGMFNVESATYRGAGALMVLKAAAEGARAENSDLAATTDVLTTAMHGWHLGADQAVSVMNSLITTVANGKMHMNDLTGALRTVLPVASAFKIHLADVEGALSTMAQAGDKGAAAGTHLAMMLKMLQSPTGAAAKEMKAMGISSIDLANTMRTSLPDALKMIQDAVAQHFVPGSVEYNRAILAILGGSKSGTAGLEIMGKNFKELAANTKAAAAALRTGGKDVENWSTIQGNFNFKLDAAKAAVERFVIVIGTKMLPILGDIATKIGPLLAGFTDWIVKNHIIEKSMQAVSAAVNWLGTAFNNVLAYLHTLQPGLAQLSSFLHDVFQPAWELIVGIIKTAVIPLWNQLVAAIGPALPALKVIGAILLILAGVLAGVVVIALGLVVIAIGYAVLQFLKLLGAITDLVNWVGGAWEKIKATTVSVWNGIIAWLKQAWGNIKDTAVSVWNGIIAFFQGVWKGITQGVQAALDFVKGLFKGAADAVVGSFKWLYDHNTYFKQLVDKIREIVSAGVAWLKQAWSDTVAFLSGLWQGIASKASSVWSSIATFIKAQVDVAVNWVKTAFNNVVSFLSGIWTKIKSDVTNLWNNVVSIFQGAWGRISGPVTTIANNLATWASNLASQALQWGTNIVNQIAAGITAGIGAVGQAVAGVAATIAAHLGFHSPPEKGPAKDSDTWMPNFLSMLNTGMAAGLPQIASTANKIAAAMNIKAIGNMSFGMGAAPALGARSSAFMPVFPAGGSNQAPIYVTVNATIPQPLVSLDGRALAQGVGPHIVQSLRAAGYRKPT